ncbi:hypothetical protein IAR50_001027 [Cryptococcus sp. DSM 104548]
MGVHGLWELLRPAAAATSLSTLSRDAFLANKNGLRALTVGIDASIWIFHAQVVLQGENPFLRTIFMKITALLRHPIVPVFVFDGPNKPNFKRNQKAPGEAEAELAVMNRQGKIDAILSDDADALLFGATCLLRNPSATLSGAQASKTNQGNASSSHQRQYEIYTSSAIKHMWSAKEGTHLKTEEDCRLAMVLVALLSGGDYTPEGTFSIGPTISHGLASAGISSKLKDYLHNKSSYPDTLSDMQFEIIQELRTNASKQVGRRYPDRANKLSALTPEELFPAATLEAYLNPCTSPRDDASKGWPGFGQGSASGIRGRGRNEGRGDLEGFASACEKYFEWGTKDLVCKKFGGESLGVFGSQVMNSAREAVRARDAFRQSHGAEATPTRLTSYFQQSVPGSSSSRNGEKPQHIASSQPPSRSPPSHILAIHSTHPDPTNKDLFEYRISFYHAALAERCTSAMVGSRIDPGELPNEERERLGLVGRKEQDEEGAAAPEASAGAAAKTETRVWVPEYLVKEAWPVMVQEYEDKLAAKSKPKKKVKAPPAKKAAEKEKPKANSKTTVLEADGEDTGAFTSFFSSQPIPSDPVEEEEDWDALFRMSDDEPMMSRPAAASKPTQIAGEVIDLCLSPSPPRSTSAAGKKRLARSPLVSSQSSAPSGSEKSDPSSVRTVRRARKKKSPVPTSPIRSSPVLALAERNRLNDNDTNAPRFSARKWGQQSVSSPAVFAARPAASMGVIDLCNTSSDEDEVVPLPRWRAVRASKGTAAESGILTSSNRTNTTNTSPRTVRSSSVSLPAATSAKSLVRSKTKAGEDSILSHPLFSGVNVMSPPPPSPQSKGQRQGSVESVSASGQGSPKGRGKGRSGSPAARKRQPMYRMISETEEGEVIDCTRRRR